MKVEWQNTEVTNARQFIFGGKSEFTIENIDSGKGAKYKISKCKNNDKMFFVRVKKKESYEYAGYLRLGEGTEVSYNRGNKGTLEADDPSIKGLMWALHQPVGPMRRPIVMYHHGKCACCGHSLDDEISIGRGIGPVCWDRLMKRGLVEIVG